MFIKTINRMTDFEKQELRTYLCNTGDYKEIEYLRKIQDAISDFNTTCRRKKLPLRVSMEYHEHLEVGFRKNADIFKDLEVEEAIKRMKAFPYYIQEADRDEHLKEKY